MRRFYFICLLIIIVLAICPPVPVFPLEGEEGDVLLDVEGSAPVKGEDLSRARNEAVQAALQKAVTQAVGRLLGPKAQTDKSAAVKVAAQKADEYVRNYRIVGERVSAGIYVVSVKVTVYRDGLRNDLINIGLLKETKKRSQAVPVTLTVINIGGYSDYSLFGNFIRTDIKSVRAVHRQSIEWGTAVMELDVQGGAKVLNAELSKVKQFAIQTRISGENSVEVSFIR